MWWNIQILPYVTPIIFIYKIIQFLITLLFTRLFHERISIYALQETFSPHYFNWNFNSRWRKRPRQLCRRLGFGPNDGGSVRNRRCLLEANRNRQLRPEALRYGGRPRRLHQGPKLSGLDLGHRRSRIITSWRNKEANF